jgi:hypothetical protein
VVSTVVREYLQGDVEIRFAILIASAVAFTVLAFGLGAAGNTAWRLATLPATIRVRKAQGGGTGAIATSFYEIVMGVFMVGACATLLMFILLAADSLYTRKGAFSGAGAAVVWPMPPGR